MHVLSDPPVLSAHYFQVIVLCHFWQDFRVANSLQELKEIYGNDVPSKMTVTDWIQRFGSGHFSGNDKHHNPRPRTSRDPDSVNSVCEFLESDGRVTFMEMELRIPSTRSSITIWASTRLGGKVAGGPMWTSARNYSCSSGFKLIITRDEC